MKFLTITVMLAATLALGLGASGAAVAGGGHHGGAHVGVGVYVGPGWWGPHPYWGPGPYYYYPYAAPYYYPPGPYYYPPAVVAPSQPPVYVERDQQPAPSTPPAPSTQPPQSSQSWFYCPSARAYYPYVKECPEGWQRVAPQPPS